MRGSDSRDASVIAPNYCPDLSKAKNDEREFTRGGYHPAREIG